MKRIVQGSAVAIPAMMIPTYCPLCGRTLENWHYQRWSDTIYPSLVCFDGKNRWQRWWSENGDEREPRGAHYQFSLPTTQVAHQARFDPMTGEPTDNGAPLPLPTSHDRMDRFTVFMYVLLALLVLFCIVMFGAIAMSVVKPK